MMSLVVTLKTIWKARINNLRKLFQLVEQGMGKSEAGGEKVRGGWVAGLCMRGVTGAVWGEAMRNAALILGQASHYTVNHAPSQATPNQTRSRSSIPNLFQPNPILNCNAILWIYSCQCNVYCTKFHSVRRQQHQCGPASVLLKP